MPIVTRRRSSASSPAPRPGSRALPRLRGVAPRLPASVRPRSKGKAVSILKAGRYRFAITDQSAKASFNINSVTNGSADLAKGSKALTGVQFVGKQSTFVTLTAGRWTYYAALGKAYYFLVTR